MDNSTKGKPWTWTIVAWTKVDLDNADKDNFSSTLSEGV